MIAYLNPLQGEEFLDLCCVEPIIGARICSWYCCYANAYPFCDLWILYSDKKNPDFPAAGNHLGYPHGVAARYQGTLCIACDLEVDFEELAEFVAGSGAMEVKDFTITPKMREDTLVLLIEGSDLGVVIGRRGETLDSLQVLTGLAANRGEGDYVRVNLDSGNFREKRTKTLEELAVKMARNAVRTGRSTTLEPMNPYDRRIIHAAVAGVEGAASTSIGDEPNRRVVISSLTPRKPRDDRRGGGHGGRGRRGGRGGDRRRDNRPAEAAAPVSEQQAAPKVPLKEAEDKPLYGKIEL